MDQAPPGWPENLEAKAALMAALACRQPRKEGSADIWRAND